MDIWGIDHQEELVIVRKHLQWKQKQKQFLLMFYVLLKTNPSEQQVTFNKVSQPPVNHLSSQQLPAHCEPIAQTKSCRICQHLLSQRTRGSKTSS